MLQVPLGQLTLKSLLFLTLVEIQTNQVSNLITLFRIV